MEAQPSKRPEISDTATWVDRYGDYLFRFAMYRLNNRDLAEDLVQETFLAGLNAKERFSGQSSEKTWLTGILKNKIVDQYRKMGRESSLEEDIILTDQADSDFNVGGSKSGQWKVDRRPAEWMVDLADGTEVKEFWGYLSGCLDKLPERTALIYVLREIEDVDTKAICNELDISSTNLRVMIHRARSQLRSCLEANWLNK